MTLYLIIAGGDVKYNIASNNGSGKERQMVWFKDVAAGIGLVIFSGFLLLFNQRGASIFLSFCG